MSNLKTTEAECRANIENGISMRCGGMFAARISHDASEAHRITREMGDLITVSLDCDDINAAEFLREGIQRILKGDS